MVSTFASQEPLPMPSPFPGMDPFIESQRWEGFHASYVSGMRDALVAKLRPRYDVDVEVRVYLERRNLEQNLQAVFDAVYDRAGYDYTLDYNLDVAPAFSETEQKWAAGLLSNKPK